MKSGGQEAILGSSRVSSGVQPSRWRIPCGHRGLAFDSSGQRSPSGTQAHNVDERMRPTAAIDLPRSRRREGAEALRQEAVR
jgi:hypothetical protein